MMKLCLISILLMIYMYLMDFINKKMKLNIMNLMISLVFCLMIMMFLLNFKFENLYWLSIYNNFMGYDYFSYGLILLSMWISLMMYLSFFNKIYKTKGLFLSILLMFMVLLFSFSMSNMFMFYLFFEMSLIPIMFMIMNWGNLEDRISASFYMLLYTLLGSLPLLIMLFIIYKENLTLNFIIFSYIPMKMEYQMFYYFVYIMGFMVKMPMYMVHLWLPKAHVEAPVFGSMILAGVLLKLGSYGIYRFLLLIKSLNLMYSYLIMSISLIGMFNISLVCLMQIDMKMLVAYSSVVHMGLLLNGIITLTKFGYEASILMNIAHGLCSSGLFYLVNVVYDRSGSRNIFMNKGLMLSMTSMYLMWFLLCMSNLAAPISLNLVSEIFLLSSLIMWNKILMIYLMFICFLSASYSLYLFSITQHGKMNNLMMMFNSGKMIEFMILLLHWLPLNIIIFNMFILI